MLERKRKGGSWGFRFYQAGSCYKKYGYLTRADAKEAEIQFRADLKNNPPLPSTALVNVVAAYLIDSADEGRSEWRTENLRRSLKKHALGFFGDAKPVDEITFKEVRRLVIKLKNSGAKPKSIWHWVSNLRATLNYAARQGLLKENPINKLSSPALRKIVGSTRAIKPPMDMAAIDRAAAVIKNPVDRAWFDIARFTGMRLDECNRLCWDDVNFDLAMIHIPGTKTDDSDAWLPLAPIALETLRALKKQNASDQCPWVFAGRSPRTKGKKVYSRRRLFEQIEKKTGTHLRPKDLRDYFATEVASKVNDPTVIMKLLRHTNLKTTTGYLRTVEDRMRAAVENLGQRETKPKHTLSSDHSEGVNSVQVLGASTGGGLGAEKLPKNDQNELRAKLAQLTKLLIANGFFDDTENGEKKVRVASSNRAKIKSLLTVPVEPHLGGSLAFLTS